MCVWGGVVGGHVPFLVQESFPRKSPPPPHTQKNKSKIVAKEPPEVTWRWNSLVEGAVSVVRDAAAAHREKKQSSSDGFPRAEPHLPAGSAF